MKIGIRVKSTFRKIQQDGNNGAIYYGYKFLICKDKVAEHEPEIREEVANVV